MPANGFTIIGQGPQAAGAIEVRAETAVEAERQRDTLRRQCGRYGTVEVWRAGKMLSFDRLQSLANAERTASPQATHAHATHAHASDTQASDTQATDKQPQAPQNPAPHTPAE
jgi:hypothetical protein